MWSDVWPAMDGVVSLLTEVSHDDRGKNERFAVARRKTRKRIAFFEETKYDFSLQRRYFFIRLPPSVETDDFITEKSRNSQISWKP